MNLINQGLLSNNVSNSLFEKVNKNNKYNERNLNNKSNENNENVTKSFKDVLSMQSNIQFSKHANTRLETRNINLSSDQMKRVEEGVLKAKQKGIKDSLVLVDNVALVVNIKNNVVVTAIQNSKEKVYTNIDGAIIV